MDHYMKIAGEHLKEFEGWSLYPGWRSRYVWGGILLGIGWFWALYSVISQSGNKFTFMRWDVSAAVLFELVWLLTLQKIQNLKNVVTLRIASEKYGREFDTIDTCRIHALVTNLGIDQSKFLGAAKECKELIDLQRIFRTRADADIAFYARKIYDPESKARLMAIGLAAISFIAAITVRSIPGDLDVFDLVSNQSFHALMVLLLFGTAFAYFIWIGMLTIWQIVWEGIVMWIVKSGIDKGKSLTALRYLIRDLVRFHKLEVSEDASIRKEPCRVAKSKILRHRARV
jgi:hypothetical protein